MSQIIWRIRMKFFYDNSIIEAKTAVNNFHVHINVHIFQNREITTMENKK